MKKVASVFTLFALSLTAAEQAQQPANAVTQHAAPSPGNNCVKGAGNAFIVTTVMTAAYCFADIFMTAGVVCNAVVIPLALHALPATVAGGCAVGVIQSPAAAASVGVMPVPTAPTTVSATN